uniref:Peptidoglycan binding-like domain-containing protein n=1 Tax=Octopus bimaculoides TaxID=37653 RepID=A0A0L8HYF5_OCTBM
MNTYRTVLSLCALAILNLDVCLVTEALQYGDQDKPSNKTDVEGYLRRYGYLTERSYSSASLGEMADALKKFQDFLQLNVTGQVDQATLKVMSMPRCGVSDVMNTEHSKVVKWNITRLTYKFIKYSQKISQNDARFVFL